METENKPNAMKQVCGMRIAFPIESDEQAIEYKKKISAVLSDLTNVRLDFNITDIPAMPNGLG